MLSTVNRRRGRIFVCEIVPKESLFQIAGPLWRKIVVRLDDLSAAEQIARNEFRSEALQLKLEVERLKKLTEEQVAYIEDLRKAGLHDLLATHRVSDLKRPGTVVSALADVVNGMEPSSASVIHDVPADEINSWVELFSRQVAASSGFRRASTFGRNDQVVLETANGDIELLERQLEFNAKSSLDREHADSLQIARLRGELRLEKHHVERVVNGQ